MFANTLGGYETTGGTFLFREEACALRGELFHVHSMDQGQGKKSSNEHKFRHFTDRRNLNK